jgi:hypothetical protein
MQGYTDRGIMENRPDRRIKNNKTENPQTDRWCNTSGQKCRAKARGKEVKYRGLYI